MKAKRLITKHSITGFLLVLLALSAVPRGYAQVGGIQLTPELGVFFSTAIGLSSLGDTTGTADTDPQASISVFFPFGVPMAEIQVFDPDTDDTTYDSADNALTKFNNMAFRVYVDPEGTGSTDFADEIVGCDFLDLAGNLHTTNSPGTLLPITTEDLDPADVNLGNPPATANPCGNPLWGGGLNNLFATDNGAYTLMNIPHPDGTATASFNALVCNQPDGSKVAARTLGSAPNCPDPLPTDPQGPFGYRYHLVVDVLPDDNTVPPCSTDPGCSPKGFWQDQRNLYIPSTGATPGFVFFANASSVGLMPVGPDDIVAGPPNHPVTLYNGLINFDIFLPILAPGEAHCLLTLTNGDFDAENAKLSANNPGFWGLPLDGAGLVTAATVDDDDHNTLPNGVVNPGPPFGVAGCGVPLNADNYPDFDFLSPAAVNECSNIGFPAENIEFYALRRQGDMVSATITGPLGSYVREITGANLSANQEWVITEIASAHPDCNAFPPPTLSNAPCWTGAPNCYLENVGQENCGVVDAGNPGVPPCVRGPDFVVPELLPGPHRLTIEDLDQLNTIFLSTNADVAPSTPEECQECDGKVTQLVLRYLADDTATVVVKTKKGSVLFDDELAPGEVFVVNGNDKFGTLGPDIDIFVDGIPHARIHTSCSQPIGPGMIFGDFFVESARSRFGGLICEVEGQQYLGCRKPMTQLSMIWDGPSDPPPAEVTIVPDNGGVVSVNGVPGNVATPGDIVTVEYPGATSNDVKWQLSGVVEGTSLFHVSCSDKDMNGPEDCGKEEGDGKKSGNYITDWILHGLRDANGGFTCAD